MALTRLGPNNSTNISGINLTSQVTGTLPTGNGGTGATTFSPGKVGQIIFGNTGVKVVGSGGGFVDTGLTASITPTATSSKILIIFNVNGSFSYSTRQGSCGVRLLRDSTFISAPTSSGSRPTVTAANNFQGAADDNCETNVAGSFLDSPSTTSQIKYQVYIKSEGAANTVKLNTNGQGLITAYEIAG